MRVRKVDEAIGRRVAQLRRERGITQVELARLLGVAQPVVSDYERGEIRLHALHIIELTRILGVSADQLLGLDLERPARHVDRRFSRRLQRMDGLTRRDQQALLRTLDAFLERAQLKKSA